MRAFLADFSLFIRAARGVPALALAILVRSVGSGGVVTLVVLYLVSQRSLESSRVGLLLTLAGFVAAAFSVPLGHLSNGSRSRNATIASLLLQGLAAAAYVAVGGIVGLTVVACAYAIADASSGASRAVLVAGLVEPEQRTMVRGWLRAITNLGSAVGAGLAGIAMAIDTPSAWTTAMVACGVALVLGALFVLRVPAPLDVPVEASQRAWGVLRDRRYATFCLLNVVLVTNASVLTVAVPIWLATEVDAPKGIFGVMVVLNTVMVVLLQVPTTRGIVDARGGVRGLARAGIALAVACAAFGLAGSAPLWGAVLALLFGVLAHGVAEMVYAAASWELSYDYAPEHAHGQYQGMFAMSSQVGLGAAPLVLAAVISGFGLLGWGMIAVAMALTGLAAPMSLHGSGARQRQAVSPS